MKNKITILLGFIALTISSCSTSYYQLYKTTASEKINLKDNALVSEDQNCIISYYFWEEGGNIGFRFFNKTDKNVYLNLEETFFVLNGVSNNYYKNRVFTNSQSSGVGLSKSKTYNYLDYFLQTNQALASNSVGKTSSSGASVAFNEEKTICVPPQTAKIISEYNINNSLYRNCDLIKYPSNREVKPKNFTKQNSPIVFSNIISYKLAQSEISNKVQNEFYVSEITNMPASKMVSTRYEEICGEKSAFKSSYFPEQSPNSFYLQYFDIYNGKKY